LNFSGRCLFKRGTNIVDQTTVFITPPTQVTELFWNEYLKILVSYLLCSPFIIIPLKFQKQNEVE